MSSEQPEVQTLPDAEDITQQATSPAPKTHVKNPKRVAAGKKVAERTKKNKEEQKKKAEAEAALAAASPSVSEPKEQSGLTVNQWIGIGGVVVSAAGLFLKRQEIMAAVKKNLPSPPPPPPPSPPVEPAPKVLKKMD